MIPTELDNIDARLTKPVLDDIEAIRKRGTGLISVRADQVLEFIERGIDSMKEIERLRTDFIKLQEIANEQTEELDRLTDVEEECARLRTELSTARAEMRERAANVARCFGGSTASAIAYDICNLPLEPEGKSS